jgi:hypothetical protein
MISMVLLVVLVALAVGSPVFAQVEAFIILTPAAACPGETVTVTVPTITVTVTDEVVGGGIGIAAVSPSLDDGSPYVLSSKPVGLVTNQVCSIPEFGSLVQGASFGRNVQCTFRVSESATCGSHYTVTLALSADEASIDQGILIGSAPFVVACCAVGGCVQPVNTFALLSPWLAVIGLVGCVGTAALVVRKRRA